MLSVTLKPLTLGVIMLNVLAPLKTVYGRNLQRSVKSGCGHCVPALIKMACLLCYSCKLAVFPWEAFTAYCNVFGQGQEPA
jgi:hypothetical protein